ncbi:MAG: hypothetical protein EHM61_15210 [Acidobacteria bacterium]|nr:MAG: hypothetical protein EHM61_15210 [Acidobacteriota bacterium]
MWPATRRTQRSSGFSLSSTSWPPRPGPRCGASRLGHQVVSEFKQRGSRVTTGDCILCQRCAHACPSGALHLSIGFDIGVGGVQQWYAWASGDG